MISRRLLIRPRLPEGFALPAAWRAEALPLALLLGLALVVRLAALGTMPGNVTADEADNLQYAFHVRAGTGAGLFGFDWKPAPMFSVWLMAQVMQVAGWTVFGTRLTSAVLSVAALVPFYLLARRQVSQPAALAATALLATNLWYLNFSRSGWENVHVALYSSGAAWCALRGAESGRWRYWIGAGAFCALGLYGYFAGRFVVVAALAFLPLTLLQHRAAWRRVLAGYGLMLGVAALLFLPQANTIRQNWARFAGRTDTVYILRDARTPEQAREILAQQALVVARAFLLFDPNLGYNSRYNAPNQGMLDPITTGLYLVGLVASVRRWRDTALWWSFVLLGIGAIQLLARGAPDGARAVGFAPFLFLFAALGLHTLTARLPAAAVRPLVGLLALGLAAYHLNGYAAWVSRPETLNARRPAVELADFAAWQEAQMIEARAGRVGFNVAEWDARRERPARGAPAQPSGQPPVASSSTGTAASSRPAQPSASTGEPAVAAPPAPAALAPAALPRELPRVGVALGVLGADLRLEEPRGVAAEPDGGLVVADAKSGKVVRMAPSGAIRTSWAFEPAAQGQPALPWDLALDPGGDVWTLDAESGLIRRYGPDGRTVATLGQGLALYRPRGLAVDGDGALYVANTGGHAVLKLDSRGRVLQRLGGGRDSVLNQPTDVAPGPDGTLFVVEPEAGRLQRLDAKGVSLGAVAIERTNTVDAPHLAFDARAGLLAMTDPARGRVLCFRADLTPLGWVDGVQEGPQPLDRPTGIAVQNGRIYVAEAGRGRVTVYEAPMS